MFKVICKTLIKNYKRLSGHVEVIEFKIRIKALPMLSEQNSVISLGSSASLHLNIYQFWSLHSL